MDVQRMRKSFDKVGGFGDEVPMFFYSHLFLCHPETRAMFPVSMMQQRDRLLHALGTVVSRVDDLDNLVPFLQQLGKDHRKFGTLSAHYPAVGASLLATLEHFAETPGPPSCCRLGGGLRARRPGDDRGRRRAPGRPRLVGRQGRLPRAQGSDVAVLRLQPQAVLPYEPGQSVSVETEPRPRLWRYYSPATAPRPDGPSSCTCRRWTGARSAERCAALSGSATSSGWARPSVR